MIIFFYINKFIIINFKINKLKHLSNLYKIFNRFFLVMENEKKYLNKKVNINILNFKDLSLF